MSSRTAVLCIILGLVSFSVVAEGFESDVNVPVLDGVDLMGRDLDNHVTLVVEEHSIAPAQELLTLEEQSDVFLEIKEGPARFLYRPEVDGDTKSLTKVRYRANSVRLPSVVHGSSVDPSRKRDSYFSIVVDGSVVGEWLRITALPKGVFELYGELPSLVPAILRLDLAKGYALIDAAKMDASAIIDDYQQSPKFQELTAGEENQTFNLKLEEGSKIFNEDPPDWLCPWTSPPSPPSSFSNNNCQINLDPRGRVSWSFNPAANFSYKRENIDNPLLRASFPANSSIDGIYKDQWGCGVALKVPGNCHLIAHSPLLGGCCRGPIAIIAGATCSYIIPGVGNAHNWPACPLP